MQPLRFTVTTLPLKLPQLCMLTRRSALRRPPSPPSVYDSCTFFKHAASGSPPERLSWGVWAALLLALACVPTHVGASGSCPAGSVDDGAYGCTRCSAGAGCACGRRAWALGCRRHAFRLTWRRYLRLWRRHDVHGLPQRVLQWHWRIELYTMCSWKVPCLPCVWCMAWCSWAFFVCMCDGPAGDGVRVCVRVCVCGV